MHDSEKQLPEKSGKKRYLLTDVERFLTEAGFSVDKQSKRYLVAKDGKACHTDPLGFHWHEFYQFWQKEVLGIDLATTPSFKAKAAKAKNLMKTKDAMVFMFRLGFHRVKDAFGYLLAKEERADEQIIFFKLPDRESLVTFATDIRTLYKAVFKTEKDLAEAGVQPFVHTIKKAASGSPETAKLAENVLSFMSTKPHKTVSDAGMKLISNLFRIKGGRDFKLKYLDLVEICDLSAADVDSLIKKNVILKDGNVYKLGIFMGAAEKPYISCGNAVKA